MAGTGQWRAQAGHVIPISDMSDEHIKNAIGVCFKRRSFAKIKELQAELRAREDPPYDISNFNP